MSERPILFSGPMVRAILAGQKRQTRRICKPALFPHGEWAAVIYPAREEGWIAWEMRDTPGLAELTKRQYADGFLCPHGKVGDQLWVRENLNRNDEDNVWRYAADATPVMVDQKNKLDMLSWAHHKEQDYCPSIHMPGWASRITLTITGVRVERVQDISEADAIAEGVDRGSDPIVSARYCFGQLWNEINGKRGYSWESNPWVWVVSFEHKTMGR